MKQILIILTCCWSNFTCNFWKESRQA